MHKETRVDIEEIIVKMNNLGLDTSHVVEVEKELTALKTPWLKRIKGRLGKHLKYVKGELKETGELAILLNKGLKTELSVEEKSRVQAQLLDFLKIFPAGVFASANAVLPIPGTSLLTPLILQKAGLLPTQWQEAHVLDMLQKEETKLRNNGHLYIAQHFEGIRKTIERDSLDREKQYSLILHWDSNKNGQLDSEEKNAYHSEVQNVINLAQKHHSELKWYVLLAGIVCGPTTFSRLPKEDSELMVRFGSKTKWVSLSDLDEVKYLRDCVELMDGAI